MEKIKDMYEGGLTDPRNGRMVNVSFKEDRISFMFLSQNGLSIAEKFSCSRMEVLGAELVSNKPAQFEVHTFLATVPRTLFCKTKNDGSRVLRSLLFSCESQDRATEWVALIIAFA